MECIAVMDIVAVGKLIDRWIGSQREGEGEREREREREREN